MNLSPHQIAAILALAIKVGESLSARHRPIGTPTAAALHALGLVTWEGEARMGYNRRSCRAWSCYDSLVTLTDDGWKVAASLGADVSGAFKRHVAECERLAALWSEDRPGTPAHPETAAHWSAEAMKARARLLTILT